MAEALVGVLLDRLASITLNKVDQELNLVIGVDKEIENLTRTLKAIQAVLEDAEQRQVQEASVRLWLNNLKEVSDEIDDVLDEWSYEILKHAANFHRHGIAKKIKDLSERLALIDAERQTYQFHYIERRSEQLIKHQKTSSVLDKSFGREYEKESLVSKLLNDGGEEESVPIIIPIVGMGGIGKTTLCQLVYNDKRVKDHFDNRIWICVSEPFEEIQIVAAIAQGLGIRDHPASNALETYSQYIISCIKKIDNGEKKRDETKFLIVLDGVRNPTESQWEQVIKPLREGARGSRILVTTRIEKVAVMMGVASNVIHLEMLSEDDCRSLFFHFAICIHWKGNKES
ncbi:putative disease resistance protein RGA3 [Rosa rugosa]|uniref:putative disease resistance protein RGA3 n=1 Tax=Rosa rugosa TaxID=74645 RepID=UPI002B40A885|nr:putative disease resistance protein RGA3 [Rosa rugosa]